MREGIWICGLLLLAGCFGDTGPRGPAGAEGESGQACTVEASSGGGVRIRCPDGSEAEVPGTSCTVSDGERGTKILRCAGQDDVVLDDGDLAPGRIEGVASLWGIGPVAGIEAVLDGGARVLTGADGKFAFEDVPAGVHRVRVSYGTYVPQEIGNVAVLPGTWQLGEIPLVLPRILSNDSDAGYDVAPDGSALLASEWNPREDGYSLWLVDTATELRTPLASRAYASGFAGPDVAWFTEPVGDAMRLHLVERDGTSATHELPALEWSDVCGETIILAERDGPRRLMLLRPGMEAPVEATHGAFWSPMCLAEDRIALYERNVFEFVVVDAERPGQPIRLGSQHVAFSPDQRWARRLRANTTTGMELVAVDLADGGERIVTEHPANEFGEMTDGHLPYRETDGSVHVFDLAAGTSTEVAEQGDALAVLGGDWIAYRSGDDHVLYDARNARSVTLPAFSSRAFDPTGRYLAFLTPNGVNVADLEETTPEARLLLATTGASFEWFGDALFVAEWAAGAGWLVPLDGEALKLTDVMDEWQIGGDRLLLETEGELFLYERGAAGAVAIAGAARDVELADDGSHLAWIDESRFRSELRLRDNETGLVHHGHPFVSWFELRDGLLLYFFESEAPRLTLEVPLPGGENGSGIAWAPLP